MSLFMCGVWWDDTHELFLYINAWTNETKDIDTFKEQQYYTVYIYSDLKALFNVVS